MKKLLFILKKRTNNYDGEYTTDLKSGLYFSVKFIVQMLNSKGIEAKFVEVIDNNQIDREVSQYKPTDCIIEALWVVPEKFTILKKLHPNVNWVVRIHSDIPFIANEGIAMKWIKGYLEQNIRIACNSYRMYNDIKSILPLKEDKRNIIYLPNSYILDDYNVNKKMPKYVINIGCFGSLRPMKNQLIQAFAAIDFANKNHLILNFHVNSSRMEQKGDNVIKNIRALFENSIHKLVEHPWLDHDQFLKLLEKIDIGMQVSLSESFNIVTADCVNRNVPVCVSHEINWIDSYFQCDPNDLHSIVETLDDIYRNHWYLRILDKWFNLNNKNNLKRFIRKSNRIWVEYCK